MFDISAHHATIGTDSSLDSLTIHISVVTSSTHQHDRLGR